MKKQILSMLILSALSSPSFAQEPKLLLELSGSVLKDNGEETPAFYTSNKVIGGLNASAIYQYKALTGGLGFIHKTDPSQWEPDGGINTSRAFIRGTVPYNTKFAAELEYGLMTKGYDAVFNFVYKPEPNVALALGYGTTKTDYTTLDATGVMLTARILVDPTQLLFK